MKRTNLVTNLISLLLFAAVAAYLGVYIVRSVSGDVRTAPAVYVELTDAATASGILVRSETLISSGEPFLSVTAENGRLMAAGETVAVAYSGEDALLRAGQIRELELRRQYILSAMAENGTGTELSRRDESIKKTLTDLAAAAAHRETEDISEAAVTLASLVLDNPDIQTTEADLRSVDDELARLRQTSSADTTAVTAGAQGLFCSSADGFEYITPQSVDGIGPSELRSLMNSPQSPDGTVVGKLADPLEWYFAALVSMDAAGRFKVGDTAYLDFGRYQSEPLRASVWSVNGSGGEAVVVFRFTSAAAEMLTVRSTSAKIVFGSLSGIRVPREAVYEEQVEETVDGVTQLVTKRYVYTVTGLQAEKKYVKIVWEDEDYCLTEPDDPNSSSSLREGNDVIITGKEIYDGMLLE